MASDSQLTFGGSKTIVDKIWTAPYNIVLGCASNHWAIKQHLEQGITQHLGAVGTADSPAPKRRPTSRPPRRASSHRSTAPTRQRPPCPTTWRRRYSPSVQRQTDTGSLRWVTTDSLSSMARAASRRSGAGSGLQRLQPCCSTITTRGRGHYRTSSCSRTGWSAAASTPSHRRLVDRSSSGRPRTVGALREGVRRRTERARGGRARLAGSRARVPRRVPRRGGRRGRNAARSAGRA